jgi:hypothetical protein
VSEKMLIKKLAKVMQEVKYIEKKGHNKFHNYKYATESDVAEKVREVLAENNVMMIPNMKEHSVRTHETAKGKTEYIATVLIEFTFMDGDTGETFSFCMAGEGQDSGDKAYYKAITGAQKYALMKAFMIPTGDDPEQDSGVDERNNGDQDKPSDQPKTLSEAQIKRLFAIAKKQQITGEAVKRVLMDRYKKTQVADLTKTEYDEVIELMENREKQGA